MKNPASKRLTTRPEPPVNGPADEVLLGRINGLFGVRGWVKVYSYARPPANILDYPLWRVGPARTAMRLVDGRAQGKGLVALLAPKDGAPLAERDQAVALLDSEIHVGRADLPAPAPGEVYWADLIGCTVTGDGGAALGTVTGLVDTGAHPVLVVAGERERLIPFVRGHVVRSLDLQAGAIQVDWDPDF